MEKRIMYRQLIKLAIWFLLPALWIWHTILNTDINPLYPATYVAGVVIVILAAINIIVDLNRVAVQRVLLFLNLILATIGASFVAGVIIFGKTALTIPNIYLDYWNEATLPFLVLVLAGVIFGVRYFKLENAQLQN
ncbi:hypothetical protein [Arcanobacterium phocae]|uniref:hypothetical protein n=1 Tax=Arcanobacterium phocae TaxID=131112 RepID=UPI001C0E91E5|nr:hypothetical protein [Arcanobacterium phocae]